MPFMRRKISGDNYLRYEQECMTRHTEDPSRPQSSLKCGPRISLCQVFSSAGADCGGHRWLGFNELPDFSKAFCKGENLYDAEIPPNTIKICVKPRRDRSSESRYMPCS